MTLTDLQAVRLRIMDQAQVADATYYGDGMASSFALPHRNLTSASAFVPGAGGWSGTGASFDPTGSVAFATAIPANSAFRTRYVYSVFSDDELNHWLGVGGSVNGAAMQALIALSFDGTRRARWMASDGTQYDDTAAIGLLKDLRATLKEEMAEDALAGGGLVSWSEEQENY